MIRNTEEGFSLVESLLVVVVVGIIVVLMANLPNAFNLVNKSKHLSVAKEIASKQIEDKRATAYVNLVNGSTAVQDQRLNTLFNASGTILVEDCSVSICTNAEHIKLVTVTITWKDNNKTQKAILQTLIGEGGLNQ